MYAAGKIPGSFFKREGRAGEKGTLTARMIDRPIRPLFPKGWHYETQLVAIPLSDRPRPPLRHPRDERRLRGADDLAGPAAHARRRGAHRQDRRQLRRQPRRGATSSSNTDLDLIVAGTDEAILMVEAGANEIPEAEILDALDIAHDEIKKLCAAQRELAEKAGKEKLVSRGARHRRGPARAPDRRVARRRARRGDAGRGQARAPGRDQGRRGGRRSSSTPAIPRPTPTPSTARSAQLAFDKLEKSIIRERIAVHKKRPDGRGEREIRDDLDRGRRRPAHARLGALHPRPDAGASASPRSAR